MLPWKDTVRRDHRRNGPLRGKDGKVSAVPATPHRKTAAESEKIRKPTAIFVASELCAR